MRTAGMDKAQVIAGMIAEQGGMDVRPEETAVDILRFLDSAERREIAGLGDPFMALTTLIQYADFTIGPESPAHHPTMPSGVAAAKGALRSLHRGITGRELDPPKAGVTIMMQGEDSEEQRREDGTRLVRALLAVGFVKDDLLVNPDFVNAGGLGGPLTPGETLLADLIEVQSEVFGLKAGDCPNLFEDYDRAREIEKLLVKCVNAVRGGIYRATTLTTNEPELATDLSKLREYQSRGLEDLGAGEMERLFEIAMRLMARVTASVPPKAGEDVTIPAGSRAWQLVEALRISEGDSVEILCDNPDGPCAVVCNGEWTRWTDRRIEGDNILLALEAAAKARADGVYADEVPDVYQVVHDLTEAYEDWIKKARWRTCMKLTREGVAGLDFIERKDGVGASIIVLDLLKAIDKAIKASGAKTCASLQPAGQAAVRWLSLEGLNYHPEK